MIEADDYEVMSEDECLNLADDGIYYGTIEEFHTTDQYGSKMRTKKGDVMYKIKAKALTPNGEITVWDNLILNKMWMFKWRHLCDSIGRIAEYENKTIANDMVLGAKTCMVIGTQPAQNGFKAKNVIQDYVKKAEQQEVKTGITKDDFEDQDIPF